MYTHIYITHIYTHTIYMCTYNTYTHTMYEQNPIWCFKETVSAFLKSINKG